MARAAGRGAAGSGRGPGWAGDFGGHTTWGIQPRDGRGPRSCRREKSIRQSDRGRRPAGTVLSCRSYYRARRFDIHSDTDLRADNLLLTADGLAVVVDWAWARRGAAWMDLAILAPAIAAAGVDPDPILAEHPATADTDPAAVDSLLCALAGYWSTQCRQPSPSPGLRSYQRRAAQTSLAWLRSRIG